MKQEKEKKHTGEIIEQKRSLMKIQEKPSIVITSRPDAIIYALIVLGICLITFNLMKILGWILLILGMFSFVFSKKKIHLEFYPFFLIINALDESDACWVIQYADIRAWHLKHSFLALSTLSIDTAGKKASHIEIKTWKYSAVKKTMMKEIPSKEKK